MPKSCWTGHELEDTTHDSDRATLRLNPPTLYPMDGKERRETPFAIGPESNGFDAQMSNYLDSVCTGLSPVNNVDQAVSLVRMLMAIYESSATGTEIRLTN